MALIIVSIIINKGFPFFVGKNEKRLMNMQSLELRKLQMLQLEIAKEIKRICDKNDIQYFIIGGTLLGAVRHKGFIPWDDDMDIGMTMFEYKKFLKIAPKQLDNRFVLQTDSTEPNIGYVFSKVRMKYTHMYEKIISGLEINDGIFVDIFPYDPASKASATGIWHLTKLRLMGKMKMLKSGYNLNSITQNPVNKLINVMLKFFPISKKILIIAMDKEILHAADCKNCSFYVERDGMFKGNFVFPQKLFENLIELPFEDTTFRAPEGYHEYLSHAYGDYMKYPPEAERMKGHFVNGLELELPYEEYFNVKEVLV